MKLEPNIHKPVTLTTFIEHKSSLTLLDYLVNRFSYHTREEWRERIAQGKVKVNERVPSEGQPLRPGDEVAYTTDSWEEPEVNKNYRVAYEDDQLLALAKPSPLPVHAIGAYFQNTLMHLLRQDRPEARDYHLVHRLDSETSGLLLLAKDKETLQNLHKQWDRGGVRKTYHALCFGSFEPAERRVEFPIGPLAGSKVRMKLGVNLAEGKPSITEFRCLERKNNFSKVEARPITGRTHQIRVHLENIGFPIVGDKLYSGSDETFLRFYEHGWDDWLRERVILPRMALHAFRLDFIHPATRKGMFLEEPLPEELQSFWNGLA